ncbi:MAG: phosphoadenylyl-sulfate reductase [Myxococcales bacterium]|nr:phosphoadenylyl-sulfate reductase [Myxococcales bacterium]
MRTEELEHADTRRILEWSFQTFAPDRIALSSAFGPSGVVLMHLASQVSPGVRVFFVDTGFHFIETLAMVDRLQAAMDVRIDVVRPAISVEDQAERFGEALYRSDPDRCCALRKVAPTQRVLRGLDAWISALRRDQGPSRAHTPVYEGKAVDGRPVAKINPLVRWTNADVWGHIFDHGLPYNPLHDEDYPSVGCAPCTQRVVPGGDERAGRWAGSGKTECGLHTLI